MPWFLNQLLYSERVYTAMNYKNYPVSGNRSLIRVMEGLLEVFILTVLYYIFWSHGYDAPKFLSMFMGYGHLILVGIYALLTLALIAAFDGLLFGYLKISDMVLSQWLCMVMVNFVTYWQLCLISNAILSPAPMLWLMLADAVVSFGCIYFFTWVYHKIYAPKKMVMIIGRRDAISLKFKMETRPDKYHIAKIISSDEDFDSICTQITGYESVIINDVPAEVRNRILKFCYEKEIRTYVTPKISDIIVRGAMDITLFDTPLLLVKGAGLTPMQRICKRVLDLAICLPALVIAAPIMLVVAIAIKIEDGGPVFFKQARVTLGGKVFNILKFRSMIVDAEKEGCAVPATEKDPRITKVGNVIRPCRFDELPQLLNIIKGDMSIVGPRPERVEHVEKYSQEIPEFIYRNKVKGGLTGYAQIFGKYNTSAYDKLRLDLMYIENYSFIQDIKLILMTARILFKKESTEGFEEKQKEEISGTK